MSLMLRQAAPAIAVKALRPARLRGCPSMRRRGPAPAPGDSCPDVLPAAPASAHARLLPGCRAATGAWRRPAPARHGGHARASAASGDGAGFAIAGGKTARWRRQTIPSFNLSFRQPARASRKPESHLQVGAARLTGRQSYSWGKSSPISLIMLAVLRPVLAHLHEQEQVHAPAEQILPAPCGPVRRSS